MLEKIFGKKINILGRRITVLKLIVIVGIIGFLLNLAYSFQTVKTFEGEFIETVYVPCSDGCGNDAVLFFKIDGIYHYLVLNSYKPGLMVELDYHVGDMLSLRYTSKHFQDCNTGISYEVI